MATKKRQDEVTRDPRDLRLRNQYFPNAGLVVFDTARKGFVPLPIVLRKMLWFLTPPELRVLIYLVLRAGGWERGGDDPRNPLRACWVREQ